MPALCALFIKGVRCERQSGDAKGHPYGKQCARRNTIKLRRRWLVRKQRCFHAPKGRRAYPYQEFAAASSKPVLLVPDAFSG
jgi:hypothetical protein